MSKTSTDHLWTLGTDPRDSAPVVFPPKADPEAVPPCSLVSRFLGDGRKAYAFISKATAQYIVDEANEGKTEVGE